MATVYKDLDVLDEAVVRGDFDEAVVRGDRNKSRMALDEYLWQEDRKYAWLIARGHRIYNSTFPEATAGELSTLENNTDGSPRLFGSYWESVTITPDPGSAGWPPTGTYQLTNEADPYTISYYEGIADFGTTTQTGTGGGDITLGTDLLSDTHSITDSGGTVYYIHEEEYGVPDGNGGYQFSYYRTTEREWSDERSVHDYRTEAFGMLASADWGESKTKEDGGTVITNTEDPNLIVVPTHGYGYGFDPHPQADYSDWAFMWIACRTKVFAKDWRWNLYTFDSGDYSTLTSDVNGSPQAEHWDRVTPMTFSPSSSSALTYYEGPELINP